MSEYIYNKTADNDPRIATTFAEFYTAGKASTVVTTPMLCFTELSDGIKYTVKNVLDDYLYELKSIALDIKFSRDDILKYQYRPKVLSSDIYGTTELYYVILAINDMCDFKEFTISSGYVKMLTKSDMNTYIPKIYAAEKADIATYNTIHNWKYMIGMEIPYLSYLMLDKQLYNR